MNEHILLVGSQNANPSDRSIPREEIKSVQYWDGTDFHEIPYFSDKGALGLSSICWEQEKSNVWYYSMGSEIRKLNLETGEEVEFEIPKLRGVHEISIFDGVLWVSNTYFDEVVAFDISSQKVLERLKLQSASDLIKSLSEAEVDPENTTRENKFHCNQVFQSYSKELFALVHHVNGEQLINRVAQKLIKSQGNGGVLNLRTGEAYRLKLKAPHSVRLVNDQYWIFDSGHAQLNVYDQHWQLKKEISMAGWGRGGAHSETERLYFAGVSAKRKRYLAFNEENKGKNMIQVFDFELNLVRETEVKQLEQVNNIYLISKAQLELIRKL